jgi:type II secretory pathway component PulK
MKRKSGQRRGAVLLMALVCLTLLVLFGASLVKLALMERKALESQQQTSQARRLAEAGFERAAAKLASDPEYRGETWSLAGDEAVAGRPAAVTIHVGGVDDRPGRRRIAVQADYPSDAATRARQSKQGEFNLANPGDAP